MESLGRAAAIGQGESRYRQLTVVIRLPAIDPFGLTSTGKLNYHISVCRYAALRAGGKGR